MGAPGVPGAACVCPRRRHAAVPAGWAASEAAVPARWAQLCLSQVVETFPRQSLHQRRPTCIQALVILLITAVHLIFQNTQAVPACMSSGRMMDKKSMIFHPDVLHVLLRASCVSLAHQCLHALCATGFASPVDMAWAAELFACCCASIGLPSPAAAVKAGLAARQALSALPLAHPPAGDLVKAMLQASLPRTLPAALSIISSCLQLQ